MTLCTFLALWTIASIPAALFWIAICKGSAVRVATNRILDADLAESGEPREAVLAAYGWR